MRKKAKLTKASITLFKEVLIDLKEKGKSTICPVIVKNINITSIAGCCNCWKAFPKRRQTGDQCQCPCHKNYNKAYLIRRVKQIIKTGEL